MIQEVGYSIFFLMHILLIFLFNLSAPTRHRITVDLPEVESKEQLMGVVQVWLAGRSGEPRIGLRSGCFPT